MNKNAIRALIAASFLTVGVAQAATTVDIPLQGVLPKACDVTANVNGPFDDLDMVSTSLQGAESITANCNYGGTLKVTLRSASGGRLMHNSLPGEWVVYNVTIGGGLLTNAPLGAPQIISNWPAVANADQTRSISVALTSPATIAGTYTDTISVEVAPN